MVLNFYSIMNCQKTEVYSKSAGCSCLMGCLTKQFMTKKTMDKPMRRYVKMEICCYSNSSNRPIDL